jgi:tetratricopeptide (TPR) repeat protein
MNTLVGIAIYDPRRLDRDSFLAGFVARGDFVEFLLDKLRHMPDVAEHHIIVGQRGMGKTSLLRRLAIGIASEPGLRERYIPLTFREEQYNVRTLDIFWRNCGEALAEWCESEGRQDAAKEIDRSLLAPAWRNAQFAVEEFLGAAKKLGGRPVLFVDNLDLILDALTAEQNWELRRTLQASGGPIVFGAATQMLRQSADRESAFYEFFHPHILEPLSEGELLQCMSRLAEARGEPGKAVRDILAAEPERIRTLHTLTGGNPRVLTLVYQLLERTESDSVFSDLEVLLDQLTPFYKARIEEYQTELQRAIVDAIALNWHPITSHNLSEATAVDVTTISSQLARFKRDGFIEEVQTSGARSGYQLVERFFNIWYLMRHGTRHTRQKIYWLTAFLTSFYAPAELIRMRSSFDEQSRLHPFYREALEAIGEPWLNAERVDLSKSFFMNEFGGKRQRVQGVAQALMKKAFQLGALERSEDAIAVCNEVVDRFGAAEGLALREGVASALIYKGIWLSKLQRSEDAIAAYDDVLKRFGSAQEPTLRERVARALINKGIRLGALARSEDAIAVYDDVVSRFGEDEELKVREGVARALVNKGTRLGSLGRSEEAIAVYEQVVSRFGTAEAHSLLEQVGRALINKGFRLGLLGRSEEAIAIYGEVVSRFGETDDPALRERVARALANKGARLSLLGRNEEAVAVYNEILSRFRADKELALREQVARALTNKGFGLGLLGRNEEAITVYDEVVNFFGTSEIPEIREQVEAALLNKGVRLGALGRDQEEIAIYDEIVRRFGGAEERALREGVAHALVNKGIVFSSLRQNEDAIGVYDEVVNLFGTAQEPVFRAAVARALINKGTCLGLLERNEEAIAVYDKVVSWYGAAEALELREAVARALISKGSRLASLFQNEEAIAAYEEVVNRFGTTEALEFREKVARALVSKGVRLGSLGRNDEAIMTFEEVVSRFGTARELTLREQVVRALVNKGLRLSSLERGVEEILVYDEVVSRFGDAEELVLREGVVRALVNKAITLGSLGRHEEAIGVCDKFVGQFGGAREISLREGVARALAEKAFILGSLGRNKEEIAVYDEILDRFGTSEEPELREIILLVLKSLAATQEAQGRILGAEAAIRRAIEIDPQDYGCWVTLGNILSEHSARLGDAEAAYRSAISISDTESIAEINLAWLLLGSERVAEATTIRASLSNLHPVGQRLLDAAFEMSADNFGAATIHLEEALAGDQEELKAIFSDDLLRLFRIAETRGYGEKLVMWFVDSGQAERLAPMYAAFVAYVRGYKYLLDFSPEVRKPAELIFRSLSVSRRDKQGQSQATEPKRRRGRPPRKPKS